MAVRRTPSVAPINERRGLDPAQIRRTIEQAIDYEPGANPDLRGEVLAIAAFETSNPEHLAVEIGTLWTRAQEAFLTIGNRIIKARVLIEERIRGNNSHLTPAERRAQMNAEWRVFLDRLPFSVQIASQLECVARALADGKLIPAELPSNYSVAYQLTTLTDAELDAARKEGLVSPRAKRDAIINFKKRLRQARTDRETELVQRRQRIVAEMERMRRELLEIERELGGRAPVGDVRPVS
ncbi:hypothetical protein [Teichococcus oryzae]|uniref:DUF3102 domain-containing protein n=1 Tax=Teichococcus oryzae TaxID=1608942 RepID=A0A5B2T930_9PROT|nr:hypothetical protein [Pseudoroseomonas oryzae]KAA2211187.1 hypothetical protein F0Q34_21420 [Pseudoroseomonas oryzae]